MKVKGYGLVTVTKFNQFLTIESSSIHNAAATCEHLFIQGANQ